MAGRPKKINIKNKVHLIAEGTDCSGKSTLIKEMQNYFKNNFRNYELTYHHFQFPKGESVDHRVGYQFGQFDLMFQFLSKLKKDWFIFDRSHIGEYIYGPRLRNYRPSYLYKLEGAYQKLPIKIIMTVCEPEVIQERFRKFRPKERCPKLADIREIQNQFVYYVEKSHFPHYFINTTKNPNIKEEIKKYIEKEII